MSKSNYSVCTKYRFNPNSLSSIKTGDPDDFVYHPGQPSGFGSRQRQNYCILSSIQTVSGYRRPYFGPQCEDNQYSQPSTKIAIIWISTATLFVAWRFTSLSQCTNLGRQVAVATLHYTAAPNICWSSAHPNGTRHF
jgi:hypothetical protein